ncbi:hypothetical protein [Geomesophilobacter sediminis]|uniref:Lipoprotein n=1 Tax=Geomesophilobacter sediminis TaxID=2798584 RepID=A0A8J7S7Y1_9BACT|nr:hypothetical protein [Geomesophilobacter sediminis]MBJ6727222.1 hypothetical protein [Geomesophilobacter sediminis]
MWSVARIIRFIFALAAAALLASCATGAAPSRMVPNAMDAPRADAASPLYQRIVVTQVGGGEETNPLMVSKVGNRELADALRGALERFDYLAGPDRRADFALEAFLVDLKQPQGAYTLIVDSHIRYKLLSIKDRSVLLDDVITGSAKGTLNDALVGSTRLRMTTEASIRANIAEFLSRLPRLEISGK